MRRRSVCHIIFRLDFGGLENGLVNLINHLPVEEFAHSIISLKPASGFKRRILTPGVRIYDVNKRDGLDIGVYERVWRLLRHIQPDIVHTRNLPALDLLAPAFLSGRRKLIHSEHGLGIHELDGKNRKYNRLRQASRLVTDHYVVVSRDLELWLQTEIGVPRDRISVIYNGVDTDIFSPNQPACVNVPEGFTTSDRFVIGTVGRLDPIKDQASLVRAFCMLLKHNSRLRHHLRLIIVGEGSAREECESLLTNDNARELAWLPGTREDVPSLLHNLDVFVLPSSREGISNTLLEAMSSGLPVIATRVGGTPEIVREDVTGKLVPRADPGALARAILDYYDNRRLLVEHGKSARRHVLRHFSMGEMVAGYSRVYKSV